MDSSQVHVEADIRDDGTPSGKYTGYVGDYPAAPSQDSHSEALKGAKEWADWMSK
jgi:hypothetical protein